MKWFNTDARIISTQRGLGLTFASNPMSDHVTRQLHISLSANPAVYLLALTH